jgi:hypothetical protein
MVAQYCPVVTLSEMDGRSSGKGRDPVVPTEDGEFGMEGVVGEGLGS